jgi:3-oxoadipate enol-lactonase
MPERLHHIVRGGTPGGPALLLIHPLGADMRFWDECVEIWQPHLACVACDLRSAGRSPRAAAPVSVAEHVADLEALRMSLGLPAVVPIGCAIGAMIAAAYAAHHSAHVAALVLSNPGIRTSSQARTMLTARAEAVRRGGMAAILPDAVDRTFLNQPRGARYERYLSAFASQDPEAYALSVLAVLDMDIAADLPKIRCPTLLIAGRHDVLLPPDHARDAQRLLSSAQLVVDEDGAHFIPFQRPEHFASLVLDFVGRIDKHTT